MTFQVSAGVYPFEIDKSAFVSATTSSIAAVVAGLNRGPLGRTLVTSEDKYIELYGTNTPASFSKAPYAIRAALKQVSALYVNRVVNGALYAGASFFNDYQNKETIGASFPSGTTGDYESGARNLQLISIDSPLVSANKFTIDIDDGEGNNTTVEQVFTNTSNETLALLAEKITTALEGIGEGGHAEVIDVYSGSDKNMQQTITFSDVLTAENCSSITGKITVMGTTSNIEANFTEDNDTTLQALATAISAISGVTAQVKKGATTNTANTIIVNCDTAGPDSISLKDVRVVGNNTITALVETSKEGHGVYDDRIIQVVLPENTQASITDAEVTLGESQASAEVQSNVKVLDFFAQNPGDWANEYGVKLTNIDRGTASRFNIVFNNKLIENNVFTATINFNSTTHTISVPFAESSDITLKAIAEAITDIIHPLGHQLPDFGYAFVEEVKGGTDNDRIITVVSPNAEEDIEILNAIVSGGDDQANVEVAKILDAEPSTQTFNVEVYTKANVNAPIETFTVSFTEQLDGNGTQLFIEEVINKSAGASPYIRVALNKLSKFELITESKNITWLTGGDNGAIPTNAQIIEGWNEFADPEKVTVRLLINAGYTNVAVQQKMVALAQKRHDCFAILDTPSDQQSAEAAVNYRKFKLNVNSSYAAIYANDLLITDPDTNMQVFVPPSGHVCAQFAYTDKVRAEWWAPAGLNRGLVQEVQGVRYKYDEGERDLLSSNQVNYIRQMPGLGYPIWEEMTLQSRASALSNIHVRRLLITLETAIEDYLQYYVFDPNDETTRGELVLAIEDYLRGLQRGRAFNVIDGEDGFVVKCDSENNPAYLLDQGVMVVDVYIKPISVARFIKLNVIIAKASASFSELMASAA